MPVNIYLAILVGALGVVIPTIIVARSSRKDKKLRADLGISEEDWKNNKNWKYPKKDTRAPTDEEWEQTVRKLNINCSSASR